MKKLLLIFLLLPLSLFCQYDDVYAYQDYSNNLIDYHLNDYSNDYDFTYTSRIRRFCRPSMGFGYYSPYFIDTYWYDPFNPGLTIYITNIWSWNSWNRWYRWNNWAFGGNYYFWGYHNFYNPYSNWNFYPNNWYNWHNWNWNTNYNWNNWNSYCQVSPSHDFYYGPRRPTTGMAPNDPVINRNNPVRQTPTYPEPTRVETPRGNQNPVIQNPRTPTRTFETPRGNQNPTIQTPTTPRTFEAPRVPTRREPIVRETPSQTPVRTAPQRNSPTPQKITNPRR